MDIHPSPVDKKKARKRCRNPENWKINIAKKRRYSPHSLPEKVICHHKKNVLKCGTVSMNNLLKFHRSFYKNKTKKDQDAFIIKCCTAVPIKRRRVRNGTRNEKLFTSKFSILVEKGNPIPVCQKVSLAALNIKKDRILLLMQKIFVSGEIPQEKRGGDHKSHLYRDQQESIHSFLQQLKCYEPHYCRSHTAVRKYLPPELNISKLFNLYKSSFPGPFAKKSYFRKIFNTQYNLGFGSPRTDMCSTCLQLTERIKAETDLAKKNTMMIEKRVHSEKAKAFFSLLKAEDESVLTLSYDCQKNLPLPKVPDQACYYSRQLYLHNFTIVQGSSKSKLTQENVFAYLWTENEFSKNANTIASAVYHHLNNVNLDNIETVRLIADGCGGQNKNSILVAMCCKWLLEHRSVSNFELVFPITGHSYLPADRVFGNIERDIKRLDQIISPQEYIDVISKFATVIKVGEQCSVYDWKEAAKPQIKITTQWKVKFLQCRRFFLKRSTKNGNVLVQGEVFYRSKMGQYENICKKNKNIAMIIPTKVNSGVAVKQAKINDVQSLLNKNFGENWIMNERLAFYANVINQQQNQDFPPYEENICEVQDESTELHI